MNHRGRYKVKQLVKSIGLALYWLPNICFAIIEKKTVTLPDGTITQNEKIITYYPPLSEIIIIGLAVVFGGIVSLFGIRLILKALELGYSDENAEITIDASAKTLKMKKLTQGAVITAIGAIIMLGALYFLTR
jgi:hypothetical protein